MKNVKRGMSFRYRIMVIACCMALLISPGLSKSFGENSEVSSALKETLSWGERIYREGILPSGRPMFTSVTGGIAAPGTTFACASCHLRSGLGALDENVYSPPVNGKKLFSPRYAIYNGIEQIKAPPLRPAYTDETLKEVLVSGKDPTGRVLNDIMPRYILEDKDANVLIQYLKSLSSQFSPGVTDTSLRFATVVTDDVSPEERDAMIGPLESYCNLLDRQIKYFKNPRYARSQKMVEIMLGSKELARRNILLSIWTLKGPSETWRAQLEEYNRKEPVFALLGGIAKGSWKPIHQFCEDYRIPCLFPNTDFPVISETDWYTLYLSKGYYQEGEGAARYLNSRNTLVNGKAIVEIVRDSDEGRALSAGFQQTWRDLGQQAPVTITLPPGKILDKNLLSEVLSAQKPAVLIIWDNINALPALESIAGDKRKPELIFVSARYLGNNIWTIKEQIRDITYVTYPFSFSPYVPKAVMGGTKTSSDPRITLRQADMPLKNNSQKISQLTDALTRQLPYWLAAMKGNYYRDYLLDVIGTMMPKEYPLYGQISFGPLQRFAAAGCYIVQLSPGDKPELIKKSNWEIH